MKLRRVRLLECEVQDSEKIERGLLRLGRERREKSIAGAVFGAG